MPETFTKKLHSLVHFMVKSSCLLIKVLSSLGKPQEGTWLADSVSHSQEKFLLRAALCIPASLRPQFLGSPDLHFK